MINIELITDQNKRMREALIKSYNIDIDSADEVDIEISKFTSCVDCRYWDNSAFDDFTVGLCYRFPPQVLEDGQSAYPETGCDDHCGEHRVKYRRHLQLGES